MDKNINFIKKHIKSIPDFPKPGVIFRDISTLLESPEALDKVINIFVTRYLETAITHIGAIDARGFIFGSIVAYKLKVPIVLFRKPGKLPGAVIKSNYKTEYNENTLEIKDNSLNKSSKIIIFDDLIATGGSLIAACNLATQLNAKVIEVASIIDLPKLKGSTKIEQQGISVFSIISY